MFKGDKVIWIIFFFLCIVSIVEVYSASSSLTYKSGNFLAPVRRHAGFLLAGFCSMLVMLQIKCKYFKLATPVMIGVSLGLLVIVLIFGQSTNGASRWMSVAGCQFQPSEIAKGSLILAVAQILSAMQTKDGAANKAFKYIMIISTIIIVPIMLENLSTAFLLGVTVYLMMIVGRIPKKYTIRLFLIVVAVGAIGLSTIFIAGKDSNPDTAQGESKEMVASQTPKDEGAFDKVFHRMGTWKARIKNHFADDVKPEEVDLDKDAQKAHAQIAIASSNFIGRGPGNSVERDFLSQAFSDFIYAIIIEETGIIGAGFVAFFYIALLFRAGKIANRCENNFPAFFCMGLALLLVTQALFNMAVAVGILPVTGQPLPLISRGGTSTIINCVYLGIILSISRTAKKKDDKSKSTISEEVAEPLPDMV